MAGAIGIRCTICGGDLDTGMRCQRCGSTYSTPMDKFPGIQDTNTGVPQVVEPTVTPLIVPEKAYESYD